MEQNGVVRFRHRRSPSSDRFLGVFSPPQTDSAISGGDELNEDEVFWTGQDFTEPAVHRHSTIFREPEKFGILAALPEDHQTINRPVVYRKPSITSSPTGTKLFHSPPISSSPSPAMPFSRAIPKPPLDRERGYNRNYSQTMPARKFQHSAPVNVPMMPKKAPRRGEMVDVEIDDDEEGDDEMLPPHEIVARGGSSRSPKTTFSVLEGVGRTLKGRDLRRVRNAVFRQTGFLD
ncbi:protein S40-7-like [Lycium ferocissimum]|uniref:protein S40-7-like n=1 Tax=Lycium ferocissimum TaxID=112874 RepID=UPI0028149D48|nr:protein S40-7-like [Lycium ferocissimum]